MIFFFILLFSVLFLSYSLFVFFLQIILYTFFLLSLLILIWYFCKNYFLYSVLFLCFLDNKLFHSVLYIMNKITFQSESTLLTQSRREIWSLSDCNWTQTQNHLVRKRTLNHLAKLGKWLSCVLNTYLYSAFDCMFVSCHVCVRVKPHSIVAWMSRNRNLKFKWLQVDSNPEPLSL